MSKKLLYILLFITGSWSSVYGQTCKASFSHTVNSYFATFQNNSTPANGNYNYYWNFGDGTYSVLKDPTHAFSNRGNYRVALLITDGSCTDIAVDTVIISAQSPGCHALFNYNILGDTVKFNNISTGVDSLTTYYWNFGDGTVSNLQDPEHRYTKGGNKYVRLKIDNASCTDSIELNLYIKPKATCNPRFTYTTHADTVYFHQDVVNTQALHYWTFGDNGTSTSINPSHIYAKNGEYIATLSLYDTTSGHRSNWSDTIKLSGIPCAKANFDHTINFNIVQFNDLSSQGMGIYQWLFGDGQESNYRSPKHTYAQAGDYAVQLTVADSNLTCIDRITKIIHVGAKKELYEVSGKLYGDKSLIDEALVVLICTDSVAKKVLRIDSVYIHKSDTGKFTFKNIPKGYYTMKAMALTSSKLFGKFSPTYFRGEKLWSEVKTFLIDFDFTEADFGLQYIDLSNLSGIVSGITKTRGDSLLGYVSTLLVNKGLVVLNMDNKIVATTFSDMKGRFNMVLNGEGVYQLYMDIPGKQASPLQFEISRDKLFFDRCIIYEDASSTFPDMVYATGFSARTFPKMQCYPNPVNQVLTVISSQDIDQLHIFDLSGKLVYTVSPKGQQISVDMSIFTSGIYHLQCLDADGNISHSQILKQ